MKRFSQRAAGMTLIEIMIVIAILGTLATLVAINVWPSKREAEKQAAVTQIRSIETALQTFRMECGRYPTKAEGLAALVQRPSGCRQWHNTLTVPQVPKDPWAQPYEYFEPGEHGQDVEVASSGPDGTLGSADDLVSWTIDGRLEEQG